MDNLLWLQQFHLIRPYWLLAIFPLGLLIWLYARSQSVSRSWAAIIDPRLLPHLLQGVSLQKKSLPITGLFILASLLVLALAGPAFEKQPQPVFKAQAALVILLDLSRSMDASDIKPSRLSRAHYKINDILKLQKEGQTALIVYAADAYVVSPLTDDAATIAAQIPALETVIMPSQGSRLDLALQKAGELFSNAGLSKGQIFILTDGINPRSLQVIKDLRNRGFTSSVLAIGTTDGAPIAAQNGGFLKDSSGSIVIPRLNINEMQQAARLGGGQFSLLTANDRDINHLMSVIHLEKNKSSESQLDAEGNKFTTDVWREEGPWLLLLVIPFAAYVFRKGLVFVLLIFILPLPQPAQAFQWTDLWKNSDQQAADVLQQGDATVAAELFKNPQWKAAAQYKAGEYSQAAELLSPINTADANYNRGNALAKAGQLEQALKAYEQTLQLQPDHADALHNKQIVEKALQQDKQQNNNKDKNQPNQPQDQQQENTDNQDGAEQNSKDQNSNEQNSSDQSSSDRSSGEQGSDEQGSNEQSADEQNSGEQNSAEQQQKTEQNESTSNQPPEQTSHEQQPSADQQTAESSDDEQQKAAEKQAATKSESDKDTTNQDSTDKETQTQQQQLDGELTPDLDQQQTQQWLKKIPDDPGGLLRRKFQYQYGREKQRNENDAW